MITAAIFLDFDNVHGSLSQFSPKAGDILHSSPTSWVEWFESGLHENKNEPVERRILLRRCYLNPSVFGRFRQSFIRAGFQVVDCPPLTSRTKNAADIHMVMDVVDLLSHPSHISEFIILSADADFTPVLHRIRLYDRIATIYTNDVTAAALRNSASITVDQDRFIEEALGLSEDQLQDETGPVVSARFDDRRQELDFVLGVVTKEIRERGSLSPKDIPAVILRAYPAFKDSDWLGCGRLNRMVDALVASEPGIEKSSDGPDYRLSYRSAALTEEAQKVIAFIAAELEKSEKPILTARIGAMIGTRFGPGPKAGRWFGHGSLSGLVNAAARPDLAALNVHPGYLMDPTRHSFDDAVGAAGSVDTNLDGVDEDLADFIRYVHEGTGWPKLTPVQLDAIFECGAHAVREGVTERNGLSAAIRDCISGMISSESLPPNARVSRASVNFILTGLVVAGNDLASCCADDRTFRQATCDALLNLIEARIGPADGRMHAMLSQKLFRTDGPSSAAAE